MANVSVIVPVYNGQKYIMAAIKSALDQTFKDIEVIIVDDGSTDRTAEIVLSFHDHVKYIYQENAGAAKARNQGVAASSGEYLAFLDCDDIWFPGKLERQVKLLDDRQEIGIVSADMQYISEDGELEPEFERGVRLDDPFCREFMSGFWLLPSVLCVRRSAYDHAGGFDSGFCAAGAEDLEFAVRLMQRTKIHYMDEVVGLYRRHPSSTNRVAMDANNEYMFIRLAELFANDEKKQYFMMRWKAYYLSDRGKNRFGQGKSLGGEKT